MFYQKPHLIPIYYYLNRFSMKKLLSLLCLLALAGQAFAQSAKKVVPPADKSYTPEQRAIQWPGKGAVPPAENPFKLPSGPVKTMPPLQVKQADASLRIERDAQGMPIWFEGRTAASGDAADARPASERALDYVASLQPAGLRTPEQAFRVSSAEQDEQGEWHVRLQQQFQSLPVYGAEMIAHTRKGAFELLNGRYFPTPTLSTTIPVLNAEMAIEAVKNHIGRDKVKTNWTAKELAIIGETQAFRATLVVYHPQQDAGAERLTWHVSGHPNLMRRVVYFIDASDGSVLNQYDHTCNFTGKHIAHTHTEYENDGGEPFAPPPPPPTAAVTATGLDLLNVNRTFGAWQVAAGNIVMEDASKAMFNSSASQMPDEPVGAIVTLNALNTSPETSQFNFDFVSSTSTTFNNKTAVSAHWNSIVSYDYYRSTFNRNSINGTGGNIISFVNVAESDGSSMENAFWNGNAMWYGNGGSAFKQLARGLDVGGHEMTHGVIEKTANLEYQDESGALNESFADIFAAMIDRDDWKIGEDVINTGITPNNALRSLEDPHNGVASSHPLWQPKHVNEQYNGTEDNGGVHINSGIVNHAFYRFATNAAVGKDKAEQVYYKALRDYLVKSSQFIDSRLAVIQAANDLYGATVANAAAAAFDAVGILGSQPGGNYLGQLSVNPGNDLVFATTNNQQQLVLVNGSGTVLGPLFTQGVKSRPSVRDNGEEFVFVANSGHIMGGVLVYNPNGSISPQIFELSDAPIWRNAALSKDGRFLAAITENQEDRIYIYDLSDPLFTSETFFLYNPTYSQGQITGEVKYADVLEFDYSGEYLMYDAYNELSNSQGQDLSYWDIGFLQFFKNGQFTSGGNPFISKLFSGLPEGTGIGNPTIAKNSPYIIAFDFIDELNNRYDIYGANVETGDYDVIVANNGSLGWPNYNRLDDKVLYERDGGAAYSLRLQPVQSNKIKGQGAATNFLGSHFWGVWYANGDRSLAVDTDEPRVLGQALSISPNPASNYTNLRFTATTDAEVQLELFNQLGQRVFGQVLQAVSGENQVDINVQGLPAGAYVLRLGSGNALLSSVLMVK